MAAQRTYLAIDLKSFYASVECVDRHLDPLTTNLVVADASRTEKTICLAVSPSLKAYKIPGRARLFEAVQRVKEVNAQRLQTAIRQKKAVRGEDGKYHFASTSFDANALNADPALGLSYIVAPPRMQRYLDVSTQIYKTYLKYVSPADIYPYSIDEVFIDVTGYLPYYHMSAHELAMTMVREVLYNTGITATAGIGTNLYLAKLAMDIVAKHIPADKDGVRIAELDEQSYRYLLWNHRPLTDFWMTGPGTVKRLEAHGIYTMGDLARFSIHGEDRLYEIFGVDAEILIDHAWGYEPCGMEQIKSYKPSTNSISEGQVLSTPYPYDKAKLIVREMAEILMFRLTEKKLVTESITLEVGYDRENVDKGGYRGLTQTDRYGRVIPKAAHGTVRFDAPTNLGSTLINESAKLFERITNPALTVRRITLNANKVTPDEGIYQVDFFTDTKKLEKEKKLQQAMLGIDSTKYLWVAKLRCRCGSSYRIFNWRKLKDGTPVFGYQCNMRTVNPTRSFVLEHNMTEQLSCDAISIPEWKLELMAKKIFEKVWGNQNKAILRACKMIESCQNGKAATRMSAAPIQSQIEKIKKRKLNYAAMRADGELPREEYQALCKQADDEIARLEQELKALSPAPEPQTVSSDLKAIYDFLSQKVDVHGARLALELIDQFVEVVTPFADYSYRWKLNTGCKKSKEERTNLMAVSEKPLLTFTIDFETAKRYREANKMPHQFRRAAWTDLTVEVYL